MERAVGLNEGVDTSELVLLQRLALGVEFHVRQVSVEAAHGISRVVPPEVRMMARGQLCPSFGLTQGNLPSVESGVVEAVEGDSSARKKRKALSTSVHECAS